MKTKLENVCHIEGYVYDHKLSSKVTGPNSKKPGTTFINGDLKIATDDDCLNIVTVHYSYVTPTTSSGKENNTFTVLNAIINKAHGTVMSVGKERAAVVRVDSAIGLNDWYDYNKEEYVSAKRNEGGFIHIIQPEELNENEAKRSTFKTDMVITNVRRIEADEERNLPEKVIVKGAVFDFRNSLLPVEFSATRPDAMNFFEGLDTSPSNPAFTKVWGSQISMTVVKTYTEESAFGDPSVREVKSSRKEWLITGGSDPFPWGEEDTITNEELKKLIADREIYLAEVKKRSDDYRASQNATPSAFGSSTPEGEFKF